MFKELFMTILFTVSGTIIMRIFKKFRMRVASIAFIPFFAVFILHNACSFGGKLSIVLFKKVLIVPEVYGNFVELTNNMVSRSFALTEKMCVISMAIAIALTVISMLTVAHVTNAITDAAIEIIRARLIEKLPHNDFKKKLVFKKTVLNKKILYLRFCRLLN